MTIFSIYIYYYYYYYYSTWYNAHLRQCITLLSLQRIEPEVLMRV